MATLCRSRRSRGLRRRSRERWSRPLDGEGEPVGHREVTGLSLEMKLSGRSDVKRSSWRRRSRLAEAAVGQLEVRAAEIGESIQCQQAACIREPSPEIEWRASRCRLRARAGCPPHRRGPGTPTVIHSRPRPRVADWPASRMELVVVAVGRGIDGPQHAGAVGVRGRAQAGEGPAQVVGRARSSCWCRSPACRRR